MTSRNNRMSAHMRREQVLSVALSIFAEKGYAATGTSEIAERAGISQPYVIRLFGRKRDLFLAVVDRAWDRLEGSLLDRAAAQAGAEQGQSSELQPTALAAVLSECEELSVLSQGFAANFDPVIREAVRNRFGRFYEVAHSLVDKQAIEVADHFIADGILLTAMAALQLVGPHAHPTPWSRELLDDLRNNGR
ncbi:TetR/AcrR family transcriptional regulator [Nocardia vinacea]|uniref:TetR/AcrR family transcriptional regulator n=1 Tax=Nocardia vinacea TaxID=96468 RepID=UPI002E0EF7D6|nr:TetR/AcrR family transcriptional regulator [Nocardia vinacea]